MDKIPIFRIAIVFMFFIYGTYCNINHYDNWAKLKHNNKDIPNDR